MRLSRWLSLLTTRNSISPFRSSITAGFSGKGIAGCLPFFGVGSGESLLVLILLLSEGVFGSSVAFRLEAGQELVWQATAKMDHELTILFNRPHSPGCAGCPCGEVAARY
jgi:hypothetical protein